MCVQASQADGCRMRAGPLRAAQEVENGLGELHGRVMGNPMGRLDAPQPGVRDLPRETLPVPDPLPRVMNPPEHERRDADLAVAVDERHRVIRVQGAGVPDEADLALFVAVRSDDPRFEGVGQPVGAMDAVRETRHDEVDDLLDRLVLPGRIGERDHVANRPGVVGDDVRQDEPFDASIVWRKTTLEELLRGVKPLRSIKDLAIEDLTEEEFDAFIAALNE